MDLFTGNAASSLHAQNARRAEQQLEYRRVASERAAERSAAEGDTATTAPTPAPARQRHGFSIPAIFRARPHTAQ
jgi:sRNA-binding protein